MKKSKQKNHLLIENMMDGYAYHQIIRDSYGAPVDCIFVDINPAFETITSLAKKDIIGKTASEILSGTKGFGFDWIDVYKKLENTGKHVRFESYGKSLDRWYEITFYNMEAGYFATIFRDITVKKRMKKDLASSETRYRRLFESAKDGILILDAETGKITDVNPFLLKLLGYAEEKILGKAIWEIGTFKDVVANLDNFLELQQKEYIRYENLPLQMADGKQANVEFISTVYLEDDHKVIQCNIRDITKRKRSETFDDLATEILAIFNKPEKIHDAIEHILIAMKAATDFDAIGIRLQKNDDFPYYTQYGFSNDFLSTENTLISHDVEGNVCRDSDGDISLAGICGIVLSGKTDSTSPLFTPGGSFWTNDSTCLHELSESEDTRLDICNKCIHQGYASIALIPIRKNQEIIGLLQLNHHKKSQFEPDIIEALEEIAGHIGQALIRKQMEKELLESEQKLSSILKNTTDVIWSLSLPDMNMFYVSPSVEKMYGQSVEEFFNNPSLWQKSVHPDDQHLADKTLAKLYKDGAAERECRIVRPDGSILWIYDKSQLIYDEKHTPIRIEGISSDITTRKQAEESLKKRLNELEVIYTVSSSLRTAKTLDEMLKQLLDDTLKVLDTDVGAIYLNNYVAGQLGFSATRGWFDLLDDALLKSWDEYARKEFASGKVLVSKEYAKNTQMEHTEKITEGWGGVFLPLLSEENILGTLFVSVQLPREITSEEIKLLTSLTEMAGTTIHRLGLFEKNVHHLEQVQALRNIDMAISGSHDLRLTFRVILDEVTKMLNTDAAAILRLDSHSGTLKYEAWRGFRSVDPTKLSINIGEGLAGQVVMERKPVIVKNLNQYEGDPTLISFLQKEDAQSYYAMPLINKGRVEGVQEIFHREILDANEEWLDFFGTLAGQTSIAIDNAEMIQNMANTNIKLIQAYDSTIKGWAQALDLKDKETKDHSQRVTEMTINIARKMGMNLEELAHVRRGALLHDIGKMGVSDAILLKPGKLTEKEWKIMRKHPTFAFNMLSSIVYLRPALDIPHCHHEKWDGTGYPQGLKGENIPLPARIFAIVDVYDALTSDRPYRKAWSREKTLEHIRQESGKHFDPQVVEIFFAEIAQ